MLTVHEEQKNELLETVRKNPDSVIGYFGVLNLETISQIRSEGVFLEQYKAEDYAPHLRGQKIHLYVLSTKKVEFNGIPSLDSTLYGNIG